MLSRWVYLYKVASLALAYPEREKWMMLEQLLSRAEEHLDGDMLGQVAGFREYLGRVRHKRDEIESEYLRVFDTGRLVSPYETEYLTEKTARKPFELADIAGFYQAFGFDLNEEIDNKEPVDHIAVELEFMALMRFKEDYAAKRSQKEKEAVTRDAGLKFLDSHLAPWGLIFCRRLGRIACDEFYKRIGELCASVLSLDCRRLGLDTECFQKDMDDERPCDATGGDGLACGPML